MSGAAVRVFVALDLSSGLREEVSRARSELAPVASSLRFVPDGQVHLTLAFCAALPREGLAAACRGLASVRLRSEPLRLHASGLARIPRAGHGPLRVCCVRLHGPDEPRLRELAFLVRDALRGLGGRVDRRSLDPHVTLARLRRGADPRPVEACVERARDDGTLHLVPESLTFFASELRNSGPVHTVLGRFPPLPGASPGADCP